MSRSDASEIRAQLRSFADPGIARHAEGFFKTAKGEYGAGDQIHGVRMPNARKVADEFSSSSLSTIRTLLRSRFHEERLLAAIMLRKRFECGNAAEQAQV